MILHAIEMGQGAAMGQAAAAPGAPLVLLHGLFGQGGNFGTVQRRLATGGGGRRVLALDLRNHGASRHIPGMTYPGMAEDVLETLREFNALPAVLIGHSMGGKVAMMAALEAPAAVKRLVVCDIAPAAYPPVHRALAEAMMAIPLAPGLTRHAADAALAEVAPPAVRAFLLHNLELGERPFWRCNLPAIAAALPTLEDWPRRDVDPYAGPTLFISGARSDYLRPEHRPLIRALFPHAIHVTLKDSGHWLHADNPEGFLALVESFLAIPDAPAR